MTMSKLKPEHAKIVFKVPDVMNKSYAELKDRAIKAIESNDIYIEIISPIKGAKKVYD